MKLRVGAIKQTHAPQHFTAAPAEPALGQVLRPVFRIAAQVVTDDMFEGGAPFDLAERSDA
jgi:hypothetical protein